MSEDTGTVCKGRNFKKGAALYTDDEDQWQ